MVQAGRAQEEAISYTGTQKRSPLTHVSKGEQASAGGGEGNSDRGITSEGNAPPVWGTAGKLSCGQRRGNMLSFTCYSQITELHNVDLLVYPCDT